MSAATKRLQYHFEPLKGWMNDPNGLIHFNGEYHAFYQHNPYSTKWDTMHWGHAKSKDLIHWEHLPIALYPDQEYEDRYGCFSGSAIEHEGKLHLFYTGVGKKSGQAQCHAVMQEDGTFLKDPKNPIIPAPPPEYGCADQFRDPKVSKYNGKFYMVVGTGKDNVARVLLYKSENLSDWTFCGVLIEGAEYGECGECPDLVKIGEDYFLMFSQMTRKGIGTIFYSGKFENDFFKIDKKFQPIIGPDFYAPQTFVDKNGRRIIIGWLYNWNRVAPPDVDFAGALTIPCELTFTDKILVNPVKEAEPFLKDKSDYVVVEENKVTIKGVPEVVHEGKVDSIKILEDTKTIEVWINDGEYYYSSWLF